MSHSQTSIQPIRELLASIGCDESQTTFSRDTVELLMRCAFHEGERRAYLNTKAMANEILHQEGTPHSFTPQK